MDEVRDYIEKLKILDRLAAYMMIDGNDAVRWANCFTEDGIFGQGDKAIRGRDKLRAYAEVHGYTLGSRHITAPLYYRRKCYQSDWSRDDRRHYGDAQRLQDRDDRLLRGRAQEDRRRLLISWRMTTVEGLPQEPGYPMLAADPEVAEIVQPLLDA